MAAALAAAALLPTSSAPAATHTAAVARLIANQGRRTPTAAESTPTVRTTQTYKSQDTCSHEVCDGVEESSSQPSEVHLWGTGGINFTHSSLCSPTAHFMVVLAGGTGYQLNQHVGGCYDEEIGMGFSTSLVSDPHNGGVAHWDYGGDELVTWWSGTQGWNSSRVSVPGRPWICISS